MQATHQTIGILGGTFDPIHFGHLRMAIELSEALDLTRVHLIPSYQPMYRPAPLANPEARFNMVKCAIKSEPKLVADNREIKRHGPTYTIDTLIEMRKEMPDCSLCLFLGMDAFLGFLSWHRFQDILDYAHLIIAYRPFYQLPQEGVIADLLNKHLRHEIDYIHHEPSGGILLHAITALDISATSIREQIAQGKNPRYLLPDEVYNYIKANQIY